MSENPRRGRQARNFTTNVPKILGLKSSSEQLFSENCRWVPLIIHEYEYFTDLPTPSPEIVTTFFSFFSPVDRVCRYVQTNSAVYCVLRSGKSHYIFADIHNKHCSSFYHSNKVSNNNHIN